MANLMLSKEDEKQVLESCNFATSGMSYLDEDETTFLDAIKKGFNRKYKVFVWNFSGQLELERYVNRYKTMIQNSPVFRSIYLYQNVTRPVKVIVENPKVQFPITDLRKFTVDRQKVVLRNSAAALTRRLYDPQVDYPIKISAYITSDSRMKVMLCLYSVPGFPFATRGIRNALFDGLDFDEKFSIVDENTISSINEAVVKVCKAYWKENLYPVEKGLKVPGIAVSKNGGGILSTINYTLSETLTFGINNFTEKANIKAEYLFTECWGELLGTLNAQSSPVLLTKKHGASLQLLPVRVDRRENRSDRWKSVESQISNFKKYSECSFRDLCDAATIDVSESFYSVFEYQLEEDDYMFSYADEDIAPTISIKVIKDDQNFVLSYSYDGNATLLTAVERLHTAYCDILQCTASGLRPDENKWRDIVSSTSSDDEMRNEVVSLFKRMFFKNQVGISSDASMDIEAIIEKTRIVSYAQEDVIVESGAAKNYVGIIVSGSVEERYINSKNMVRTISICMDGQLLNLEGLTAASLPTFSYCAIEDTVVLWVPSQDLKVFMDIYPECWANTLDKVLKSANRMKKLWGLE